MNKNIIWLLVGLLCFFGSCSDFLEEKSHDLTYASSCKDMNELLVGGGYMKHVSGDVVSRQGLPLVVNGGDNALYFPWIHVMDDDVTAYCAGIGLGEAQTYGQLGSFYRWEKDPCNVEGNFYNDNTWDRLYRHIGVLNVILNKVDEFTNDPESERDQVKGECYFLRAAYYFLLVNFYAPPYSHISASSDPGVPLKITPYINMNKDFTRTPVDTVYHQIVRDLQASIACLNGKVPKSIHRASVDAARVLLSRVYCYMGKWELVPELCDEVLKGNYYLLPMNEWRSKSGTVYSDLEEARRNVVYSSSPETIFTQGSYSLLQVCVYSGTAGVSTFVASSELTQLYDPDDTRPTYFFRNDNGTSFHRVPYKFAKNYEPLQPEASDNFLIRLPEVYLNKAEALAMNDDNEGARDVIQQLRAKRYITGLLPAMPALTGEALVNFIRDERRRELCFEGHRWFDLRRYAVSSKYPMAKEIRHDVYGNGTSSGAGVPGVWGGYYKLERFPDGGWVLPIPQYDIEKNHWKLVQNERPERMLME